MAMQTTGDNAAGEPMMDINTTPLIDVMLVLLIMFIITIPIQTHAVKLDLPVNQPNQVPPPIEPIKKDPQGGSTDVGDVSWVVPTLHFYVATAPFEVPWHAWPVVASSRMSIGHKGMMFAAKGLAATAVDLFQKPEVRAAIRQQFDEQTKGKTYKWLVADGPPPIPAGQ